MAEKLWHHLSLTELGRGLSDGSIDPYDLAEYYLSRINHDEEKDRIYIQLFAEEARQIADVSRMRAKNNTRLSLFDGIPIAWKDNFDMAGKPTSSGIPALAAKAAENDAVTCSIAKQAGLVFLGKTNMTELAFSGIGINPSYGTPRNPFDHAIGRVPGGSSCGSAVAVAKGLCAAAIGSDTGGSIRIPAAWNNLVGFKPTVGRISTEGVVPLCQTMDTVGILTRSVADAAVLFDLFSEKRAGKKTVSKNSPPNLLLSTNLVWDDIHTEVQYALDEALQRIERSPVQVARADVSEFDEVIELVNTKGNIVHYEGFKNWGSYLNAHPEIISPDILAIFNMGATISENAIQQVYVGLNELRDAFIKRLDQYDAVLMPTVVHIPPVIDELESDSGFYARENALALRNTRLANLLGLCAISIPAGFTTNGFPAGLMLVGAPDSDEKLLTTAAVLEQVFQKYHEPIRSTGTER